LLVTRKETREPTLTVWPGSISTDTSAEFATFSVLRSFDTVGELGAIPPAAGEALVGPVAGFAIAESLGGVS